ALAQRHVAAALAVDRRAGGSCSLQRRRKALSRSEPAGMQFGVPAREVYGVGGRVGKLVGERREKRQLGAVLAPALQNRRVEEDKGVVARDGDPRSERR